MAIGSNRRGRVRLRLGASGAYWLSRPRSGWRKCPIGGPPYFHRAWVGPYSTPDLAFRAAEADGSRFFKEELP
jgi:hypothetical protein